MPIELRHERDNVYRVEVSGTLRKAELDRCQERLAAEIRRVGPVRLLFVLTGFQGWEPRTDWNDLTFYVRHGDAIERIAFVGPDQWRSQVLMFAGADLRKAAVEFFPVGTAAEARAWLSS
jgi:hypothetical protein